MNIRIALLGVVLVLIGSFAGFAATINSTEELKFGNEFTSISVSGYNGSINWIPVGETDPLRIVVEKEVKGISNAALKGYMERLIVQDLSRGNALVLKVEQPQRTIGVSSSSVTFTVYAPVSYIEEFNAQTSNGSISVAGFQGELRLRTSNGKISLGTGQGVVFLDTSNGAIEFGQVFLTDSSTFHTSNGRITGEVSFAPQGRYTMETSNGRVELTMPSDTEASFHASTSNGRVDFRLGADVISGKDVSVRRGSGSAIVNIKTSNGDILIRESN